MADKTSADSKAETSEPQTETPKPSRKRLNLDLTPETYELLQQLSEESGKSMAEILRTGLALYGVAQEEKKKGNNIAVVDGSDQIKKQFLLP